MTWLTWIFYFIVFDLFLRYPYIVAAAVLIYIFRDRIPNPADLMRKRKNTARLFNQLGVNPSDLTARRDLGMLLLESGKAAEARDVLAEANHKDPDSVEINHLLGLALLRTGKNTEAAEHLSKAVEMEPRFRYGESHLYLGEALLAQGKTSEALESLREYMSINNTSIEGLYFLAKALAASGDKKSAAQTAAEGIGYHKGNPSFRRRRDWRWYVRLKSFKKGL